MKINLPTMKKSMNAMNINYVIISNDTWVLK